MLTPQRIITPKTGAALLLLLYIGFNLFFLTRFPFVHSDETWLSGLSRNILETGSYAGTETFFDLYPRYPHAIKSLFHTLQIIFIRCFGYELFTLRLLSFFFGLLALIWFYKLCRSVFGSEKTAFAAALLLAVDVQFIYASHFARQEIILLFILVFTLHYLLAKPEGLRPLQHIALGLITGVSIGIHPNSFLISLPLVFIYLFHIIFSKKISIQGLLAYGTTAACFAAGFIVLSLSFDAGFFSNYAAYGSQFGVTDPLSTKILEIKNFYLRLYYGVSGTYYTPDIRLEFCLFPLVFLLSFCILFKEKNKLIREKIIGIMLAIAALNCGIILIGRFSQPSIVFLFPLYYILITYILTLIPRRLKRFTTILLALALSLNSLSNAVPYLEHRYDNYLQEIAKAVPSDGTVLANLNAELYFDNAKLYDYRNLAYLQEYNLTFEHYISRNKIEYIIYPEEMDLIYAQRPRWNGLYGNLYPYYADMQKFLRAKCVLIHEFSNPTYGIRIAEYINTKNWKIKVYKVARD